MRVGCGMADGVTLVWLRQDLRLEDQPALAWAARRGGPVVPVFIWAPEEEVRWAPGGAARVWLHAALTDLDGQLRARGLRLILRRGPTAEALARLVAETGATGLAWNRRYEPAAVARDGALKVAWRERGLEVWSGNAALLVEPHEVQTQAGRHFQVYTPFWKTASARPLAAPVATPGDGLRAPALWPDSLPLEALELLPRRGWDGGIRAAWEPTRAGAESRLRAFAAGPLPDYREARDFPDRDGTSRLSPYLHWGQLGPREVAAAVTASHAADSAGAAVYLKELWWREFAHHVLHHAPHTPDAPLRPEFNAFPWRLDGRLLEAWSRGRTGYPIVDAGMRQLWATGWMHNRVRMVVASFLVKHLLQPWQEGARWFWDTLVDADLASNTLGWQWTAGCGADAAPFFRIFNPITQGRKFDPDGRYVRHWVPELQALPDEYLHAPWEAPGGTARFGYPGPIVDHSEARARALQALASIKQ